MLSSLRVSSVGERPRIAPASSAFSQPVYSKLKPAPSSSRGETRPRTLREPSVGFTVPDCLFAGYGLGHEVDVAQEPDLHYLDAATAERAHRRHLAIV